MSIRDGANYAPESRNEAVVGPGEFCFAAAFLDHGHIYGQTNGLIGAGGTLTKVYDPQPQRVAAFLETYPDVEVADSFESLLEDKNLHLIF